MSWLLSRAVSAGAACVAVAAALGWRVTRETHRALARRPLPEGVHVVASDFTWAENLHFDSTGRYLFVTEMKPPTIFRIEINEDGTTSKVAWIDNATLGAATVLGLASGPDGTMFTTGYHSGVRNSGFVASFSSTTLNTLDMVAQGMSMEGNGLAYHASTHALFVASEGNLLPGDGKLIRVDVATHTWAEIPIKPLGVVDQLPVAALQNPGWLASLASRWISDIQAMHAAFTTNPAPGAPVVSNLWGADGLWIDQSTDMLYVGELLTGKVWRYNLTTSSHDNGVPAASICGVTPFALLDDFTLTHDSKRLIACDWSSASVIVTDLGQPAPSNAFRLVSGINSPTSIRWGPTAVAAAASGPPSPWRSDSLFVTEGENVFPWQTKCRVLEIRNAAEKIRHLAQQ